MHVLSFIGLLFMGERRFMGMPSLVQMLRFWQMRVGRLIQSPLMLKAPQPPPPRPRLP